MFLFQSEVEFFMGLFHSSEMMALEIVPLRTAASWLSNRRLKFHHRLFVLCINESSVDHIKRAYRKLPVKYHPSKNQGNEEANKRFTEIKKWEFELSDLNVQEMGSRECMKE